MVPCLLTACLPGTFGEGCAQICQCPGATQECHPVTGACVCPPGFHGPDCQLGESCSGPFAGCPTLKSRCREGCVCVWVEFRVLWGCSPPGGFCRDVWTSFWRCRWLCPCGAGVPCHPVTGDCVCPPGRAGPTCEQGKCGPGHRDCQALGRSWAGTDLPALRSLPVVPVPTAAASGPAGCERHRYGPGCQQPCSCRNGGLCDTADGSCSCAPGWTGKSCELGNPGPDGFPLQLCRSLSPAECPPGMFGASCQLRCSCLHNATCDPATGTCRCPAGRYGPLCEHSEWWRRGQPRLGAWGTFPVPGCPPGFHGEGCRERCDCEHGAGCDPATGRCRCPPGLRGERCHTGCKEGTYGEGCQHLCDCPSDVPCDPATGRCLCPPGKTGPTCAADCRPTQFGPDCRLSCQCDPSSSYCNARNGQCLCLNGHTGPTCREGEGRGGTSAAPCPSAPPLQAVPC
uniref:EGF-like domain-containing protein n=1 Tax=Cyanoderma ruficeps TaxID=181631 RepID=A0A8C3QRL3_9PASS